MKLAIERSKEGKFILRYDASLIGESNCLWKVWLKLFRGLRGEGENDFKMDYGTAFHKAMVVHYSGGTIEEATAAAFDYYKDIFVPDGDWRDMSHLLNCIIQYCRFYKAEGELLVPDKDSDGKPALEKSFSYPFHSTPLTDVLLQGTIDMKGHWNREHNVIVDHKTTALSYPDKYLNSYSLSYQLMTYKMIYEMLFPGTSVGCMINGVFLNKTNKNTFRRSSLLEFTPQQMDAHRRYVTRVIKHVTHLFEMWVATTVQGNKQGAETVLLDGFIQNFTCCKEEYGMCEYLPVCMAPNNDDKEGIILTSYTSSTYDPLKFQA